MFKPNQCVLVDRSFAREPFKTAAMIQRRCMKEKFQKKVLLLLAVCFFCTKVLGNQIIGYCSVLFDTQLDLSNFSLIGKVSEAQRSDNRIPVSYQYKWSHNSGLPFQVEKQHLQSLGFPISDFVNLSDSTLEDFVFVTAANEDFVENSIEGIATIQQYFPHRKIIFYDLGMKEESIQKVKNL